MKTTIFRTLIISFAIAMLGGCSETPNGPTGGGMTAGEITLVVDKAIIHADGVDAATLTVYMADGSGNMSDVTAESDIYIDGEDNPIESNVVVSSTDRQITFYAAHGFAISNEVGVEAVSGIAPLPADEKPATTAFNHKVLLVQHTGTDCAYCPELMTLLKLLSENGDYNSLYLHLASHSFRPTDPAYSSAAVLLSNKYLDIRNYPSLTFDLTDAQIGSIEMELIKRGVERFHKERATVGISASVTNKGDRVYTNVGVKAAEDGTYRIATYLLEDNIYGTQASATAQWQNTHHNCLREMAGADDNEKLFGVLQPAAKGGEVLNYISGMTVQSGWKVENCKVLVLVCVGNSEGNWELANCTVCPMNGSVAYDYAE